MSSHKAATAKAALHPTAAKPAAAKPVTAKPATIKPAAAKPRAVVQTGVSADAIRLANEIEQAFTKSDDAISMEAMQALMGALCRIYAVQAENGAKYTPIAEGQVVSPTAVMVTASGLLRAGNLAVFELGMWQSWTGR